MTGDGGLLTGPIQQVLQGALEAEITDHLGYEPHAAEGRGSGNIVNEAGLGRLDVGDRAVAFWHRAVNWFANHGICVERVLTDNGACYRSRFWIHYNLAAGLQIAPRLMVAEAPGAG